MEIGQVGPVLRHCLRHSRGDNRVGFPGSDRSQACGDDRGRSAGDHRLVSTGWYGRLEDFFLETGRGAIDGESEPVAPTSEEIQKLLEMAPEYGIEIRMPPS